MKQLNLFEGPDSKRFWDYQILLSDNIIAFDKEISLEMLGLELGETIVVDVKEGRVCFVPVELPSQSETGDVLQHINYHRKF